MPGRLSRMVDLLFTTEGDFVVGNDGDLADTKNVAMRGLIQRVITRLSSAPGDWDLAPSVGVSLSAIMGKRNTRENGKRVEEIVAAALTRGGLLRTTEFSVVAFPADKNTMGILLEINPADIVGTSRITFVYDLRDNKLIPRTV